MNHQIIRPKRHQNQNYHKNHHQNTAIHIEKRPVNFFFTGRRTYLWMRTNTINKICYIWTEDRRACKKKRKIQRSQATQSKKTQQQELSYEGQLKNKKLILKKRRNKTIESKKHVSLVLQTVRVYKSRKLHPIPQK